MLNIKRSGGSPAGFRTRTPSPTAQSAPAPSVPHYAAMGFIARCADGSLLRMNAVYGQPTRITYKRRFAVTC